MDVTTAKYVGVHESGGNGVLAYLVMECIEGPGLECASVSLFRNKSTSPWAQLYVKRWP